jgi:hypothetical protein
MDGAEYWAPLLRISSVWQLALRLNSRRRSVHSMCPRQLNLNSLLQLLQIAVLQTQTPLGKQTAAGPQVFVENRLLQSVSP